MHPHFIFLYPCVVCVVCESEASRVRASASINRNMHAISGHENHSSPQEPRLSMPNNTLQLHTRSFQHSFNHDIMSIGFLLWKGAQMQLLVSLHKADKCTQMREKLCRFDTKEQLHITRMRDKCLKDFNETVTVDVPYPADGVGLMLRKYVRVANYTFRWNRVGFYKDSWVTFLPITSIWLRWRL